MRFLLLGGWRREGGAGTSWSPPGLGSGVWGALPPPWLKGGNQRRSEELEFASAFLPEATASIKDDLGPLGPLHFQKNPWKVRLPLLPGRSKLRTRDIPTLHVPPKATKGCHSPATPGQVITSEHQLQRGLFRVYPTPRMENFPSLPAIPRFFMFFLSSLFSLPKQGSRSALLIRGWL